jgi:hypothetical protein
LSAETLVLICIPMMVSSVIGFGYTGPSMGRHF